MNNVIQGTKPVAALKQDSEKELSFSTELISSLRGRTPSKTKPTLTEGKHNYINGTSILEL